MSRDQKRARWFGVLYLITFVTGIAALALYETVLRHPVRYIAGPGHDTQVLFGALLELLLIIANIGTAVVIFPIVRRQNEELALGYVTARLFECSSSSSASSACSGSSRCETRLPVRLRGRSRTPSRRSRTGLSSSARAGSSAGERADPRLPDVQLGPGAATGKRGSASSADR